MSKRPVDVVIHIDESLTPAQRDDLLDGVRDYDGVLAVEAHENRPHLLVVKYDAEATESLDLLNKIKAGGLHAELIGL